MTPEQLARMRRLPDVKALRVRLGMTQEQFASTYCLPLGTVRDWEQGRTRPDAPALALLAVIDREPEDRAACPPLTRFPRTIHDREDFGACR